MCVCENVCDVTEGRDAAGGDEFREVASGVTRPQDGNFPKKTPGESFQKLSEIPGGTVHAY